MTSKFSKALRIGEWEIGSVLEFDKPLLLDGFSCPSRVVDARLLGMGVRNAIYTFIPTLKHVTLWKCRVLRFSASMPECKPPLNI